MKDIVNELKLKIQEEKQLKKQTSAIEEADAESISSDEDSDSGESEDNLDPD
jgi:hypothetical protein